MSKGMIVLDEIPERCECCLVETHYENQNGDEYGHQCPFTYAGFTLRFREEKRADWCPIRPIPEKKEVCGRYPQPDGVTASFKVGWNACIEEILRNATR